MKNIVLIGAPGSGKGTQGDRLKGDFNFLKVALGDILREYRKDATKPVSHLINSMLDSGKLLPNEIVNSVAEDFVINHYKDFPGIMFDGYPRSIEQAEFLDTMLNNLSSRVNRAILFDINLDALTERLQHRYMCNSCGAVYNYKTNPTKAKDVCDICGSHEFSHRKDDAEVGIIKTRFAEFQTKTSPVIDYYKNSGKLIALDANRPIDLVYHDLFKIVNEMD